MEIECPYCDNGTIVLECDGYSIYTWCTACNGSGTVELDEDNDYE